MMRKLFAILVLCCAAAVPASAISALQLAAIEKKAFDGDAAALYALGQYYEIGDGVPADKKIADCYYTAAANLGYKAAKIKLGLIVAAPPPPRSTVSAGKAFSADCGNGVTLELLPVPAGTGTMGSPSDEEGRSDDEAQARVNITKPFWLGKTEVTQAQWQAVMGSNPSYSKGDLNLPVECVSWDDAMDFCKKLTEKARAAGTLPENVEFTLPTEAQWEYACRAGTTSRFCFGDEESDLARAGWYYGDSESTTHAVGQKSPNKWGFYDMHGNVWEWCLDYYDPTLSGGNDPFRATPGSGGFGSFRVFRGGGWSDPVRDCRSASRADCAPGVRFCDVGFRVAVVIAPPRSTVSAGKAFSADCGNGVKLELLPVPAGTFTMGSPSDEEGRFSDEAQARVNITKPFWLGKTEVTQAQWQAVMGNNPSYFKGDLNLPVECVSWDDAMDFCKKLTAQARAAGTLPANVEFTLPTEAQWEYACRAGTTSRFCFGDEESSLRFFGNYYDKSGDEKYDAEYRKKNNWTWSPDTTYDDGFVETSPVASFRQNEWGFYDMHGNVWEWCLDYYNPTLSGGNDPCRATPGSGIFGSDRVFRGGSWNNSVRYCRSAYRVCGAPGIRILDVGFRVAAVSRD